MTSYIPKATAKQLEMMVLGVFLGSVEGGTCGLFVVGLLGRIAVLIRVHAVQAVDIV